MKVAFPTDDRKTICKHTGRAKEFAVYELSDDSVINIEYIENEHHHHEHHHHGHGHSHKEIVEKLKVADYLYVNHVGKYFKANLEEAELKYEITNEEEIISVVKDFFDEASE